MKSLERVIAAVKMEEVDRTPIVPVLLQQGARMLNIPLTEYFSNPTRLAEGQTRLIDRFDHDAVFAIPHVVQDTIPWGAGLSFHEDGPPAVNKMVFRNYKDIAEIPIPDPTVHPYTRNTLATAKKLAKRFKGDRLIVGAVIGPFSLPSMLMGMHKSLALLISEPEMRAKYYNLLMDKMMTYTVNWANAQLDAGCDIIVLAEGMASSSIISEQTFVREAKHVLTEFVNKVNGFVGLEMVGDSLPIMHHLKDIPAEAIFIGGKDPVAETRQILGQKKAIIGNLNNLKLLRWDAERVEFEARRAILASGRGYILGAQAPEIPWYVSDANIDALVKATRRANRKIHRHKNHM